ncbi:MAG: helix-turn-helix domain-containing protein [Dehalococcoidia bacterium]
MTGLGRRLQATREAKGLGLEEVERETRIVRRYLLALEAEDFTIFPAEVYARGFLRSYSSFLGLNVPEMMALFPQAADGDPPAMTSHAEPPPPRPGPHLPRPDAGLSTTRAVPALVPALAVVALIAVALVAALMAGGGKDPAAMGRGADGAAVAPVADATAAPGAGPRVSGRMPDLRGADEAEALARLQQMGVTPFIVAIPSRDAPAGRVIRQSPAPEAPVGESTVVLVVSQGG